MNSTEATRTNLLGMPRDKLAAFFVARGEKRFRADQLMKWLYHRGVSDLAQMTDLSSALREQLALDTEFRFPEITWNHVSTDGTRKWLIQVEGGGSVETVFIPEGKRGTLCVSSQVGCTLDCSFCSTGKQGFQRNLSAAEIIAQIWIAQAALAEASDSEARLTNVVFMGMGEPLLNLDAVLDAISIMTEDLGYGLSRRRVTVSTAGVVPGIERLGREADVSLAISLHAPFDELRNTLVPVNRKYPIAKLLEACRGYLGTTAARKSITIEYTLMAGVNDQPEHAVALAELLEGFPCKLNLIPFNPFPNSGYRRPSNVAVRAFQARLQRQGFIVTVRTTRGDDIDAACGQLVGDVHDRTRRSDRYIARVSAQDAAQISGTA